MEDVVHIARVDLAVCIVTINRPEVRNAVDGEVTTALDAAVRQTEEDPTVSVVILTGAGDRAFSAGADLKALSSGRGGPVHSRIGGFAGFVNFPRSKPWIAAVNGAALAGGCEIALACDIIVASDDASFGLPEVRRGLVAAGGGVYRLMRSLPRSVAMEMILTGAPISAKEAKAAGLVSRIVPRTELPDAALALARSIAANAPLAVRASLAIARKAHDLTDYDLSALSLIASDKALNSEDFAEGARAFIEKREPCWTGR